MEKTIKIFSSLFFFILIPIVYAAPPVATWWGNASIDGNYSIDGEIITAYVEGVATLNTTVGAYTAGYYLLDVPCSDGENVSFKYYDITAHPTNVTNQTCSQGDRVELNLSITKLASGVACTAANSCTGGYCVYNVCRAAATYCGDGYCDSGETCSNCVADCGSCGGGGTILTGGNGGGTPTTPAGVVNTTVTIPNASSSSPAIITIDTNKSKDLKIDEVKIEVNGTVNNATITVKESTLPTGANFAIGTDIGATYKYLDITTNIPKDNIEKVTIKFKVEKSWLTTNNIDPSSISLQRYVNDQWVKLPTTIIDEDDTYIYFETESPGLSVFAIIGAKKAACPFDCCTGEASYIDKSCAVGYECKNRECTVVEECVCTDWSDIGCDVAPCAVNEMKQTRSCTPSACDKESQCMVDESCVEKVVWIKENKNNIIIGVVIIVAVLAVVVVQIVKKSKVKKPEPVKK